MYIPSAFAVDDRAALLEVMRQHSFATLITVEDGQPFATHLPLLIDADRGAHGVLVGHVARGNPQWRHLEAGEALVIFQGPHAYVSPAWYGDGPPNVPTWNYIAVHAYGAARIIADPALVAGQLRALVEAHEAADSGWSLDLAYAGKAQAGVVAFELEITRLEGKFKLSQNKPAAARAGVAAALAASPRDHERAVAAAMLAGDPAQ
ncbi:MAG TPA: FMN-binding negative transcriptional regulator [Herpetosiphonaceae bacterium]|nr:FMN-binding negative transcriptional regulator [Herpetosiphonaceae bacterium]